MSGWQSLKVPLIIISRQELDFEGVRSLVQRLVLASDLLMQCSENTNLHSHGRRWNNPQSKRKQELEN